MTVAKHVILTALLAASTLASQAAEENKANIGGHSLDGRPEIAVFPQHQPRCIGDVAHGYGVVCLLRKHIPEARIRVLKFFHEAREMYGRHFQDVKGVGHDWLDTSDLLITSSGPVWLGLDYMRQWVAEAGGKPFGTYGVTGGSLGYLGAEEADAIRKSSFLYFRDTKSLEMFKDLNPELQTRIPEIGFVPDGVFGFTLLDDEKALQFLAEKGLKEREYLCVVMRLRRTPPGLRLENGLSGPYTVESSQTMDYFVGDVKHTMKWHNLSSLEETMEYNRKYMEADHAPIREAITIFVRKTGMKVLLCPEMTYHLDAMGPLLRDPLPEDVKSKVVIRDTWWLPDEAASVYKRAFALLSLDCHSPIIASVHETPVFVYYFTPDSPKYQMWEDIGLGDWSGPVADTTGARIAEKLLAIHEDYDMAKKKMRTVMDGVRHRHWETMNYIRGLVNLPPTESRFRESAETKQQ